MRTEDLALIENLDTLEQYLRQNRTTWGHCAEWIAQQRIQEVVVRWGQAWRDFSLPLEEFGAGLLLIQTYAGLLARAKY